jgi:hydroxymethylglutaryl-CoA reductase (NADPH)
MILVHCSQLSRSGESDRPAWHDKSLIMRALHEEDQKPNPVVQRVKVIMSAGLMLVHVHRYVVHTQMEESDVLPSSEARPAHNINNVM